MDTFSLSPLDRPPGNDVMDGRTFQERLQDPRWATARRGLDEVLAPYPEPRPALEIARADLAGTLKGLVAIVLVFALIVVGAAAWGGPA